MVVTEFNVSLSYRFSRHFLRPKHVHGAVYPVSLAAFAVSRVSSAVFRGWLAVFGEI
jgi:hypothetical protein